MKGIILAGGTGSRLFPITIGTSKQLLPIFDKPMAYYPLSVLMLAQIKEVLFITTPQDQDRFKKVFGDGSRLGMKFDFIQQESPDGIAQAFKLGANFIKDDDVCLVLGDNLLYGDGLRGLLRKTILNVSNYQHASIFTYPVSNPQDYGVVEVDSDSNALSIEEKPTYPRSKNAVIGLYFFPNNVIEEVENIEPSSRGELEITSLLDRYLSENKLKVEILGRGYSWLDTGLPNALLEASEFVRTIQNRQGLLIAAIEEISFLNNWIDLDQFNQLIRDMPKCNYKDSLLKVTNDYNKK